MVIKIGSPSWELAIMLSPFFIDMFFLFSLFGTKVLEKNKLTESYSFFLRVGTRYYGFDMLVSLFFGSINNTLICLASVNATIETPQ
jgi:hypothetical protein